jgi:TolB-like protein
MKRLKRDTSGESVATTAVAATPAKQKYLWPVVGGGVVVLLLLALLLPLTVTAPTEAIDSIAILPFENRSGDPELEYISDGIADGIINRLSQLPSLNKVIASSSVRGYKGRTVDAATVTQEVDVRAVVMGSMVQLGDNIRVNVQLIDGENNSTLWGESYTRPRSAVYELEETLSREIADALGIQLTGDEGERLTQRYTENVEAHEAYFKGKFERAKSTPEGTQKAIQHFEEAIQKDPNYALAYAAMAQSYWLLGSAYGVIPPEEAMPKAEELAMKALEIDNMLGQAHWVLGTIRYRYHWDWEGAEKEFKLALELDPGSSGGTYAALISTMGRHDEAIAMGKRANQLNPAQLGMRISTGVTLHFARRYDEAVEQFQMVLDLNPNFHGAYQWLSRAYESKGLHGDAVSAYQKFLTLEGIANEEEITGLADAYQTSGKEGYWRWMLDYWTERAKQEYVPRTDFAMIYAYLSDKDQAMRWLEEGYKEHEFNMTRLNVDPEFDPLRSDPRFQDLLRRMNLEP